VHITVVKWQSSDGIASDIFDELHELGHQVVTSVPSEISENSELVLTYAPWGRMLSVTNRLNQMNGQKPPLLLHWNLENPPDLAIPWPLLSYLSRLRLHLDRLHDTPNQRVRQLLETPPLVWLNHRAVKYRYLGEYYYIFEKGWLGALVDTSHLFTAYHNCHGLLTYYVPWGTSPNWHSNLKIERDIDVLWLGKLRTRRRKSAVEYIREELNKRGFNLLVVDGIEHALVFGHERTRLINRTKIALHVNMNWYDNSFHMRYHMVAGNRAMVVSENLPPHYEEYTSGIDYVATDLSDLVNKLLYYLTHDKARLEIADNAYELVTTKMNLRNSVRKILELPPVRKLVR
jgi:hypothetical protein